MIRKPSIRVRRIDTRADVPGTISVFVKSLVRTVYGSTQTVMLTDSTIRELDQVFKGSTHADLRAAGIYYGEIYLQQKDHDWSPTQLINCFLFVPRIDPTTTTSWTGPYINQLMARNARILGKVNSVEAVVSGSGAVGVMRGLYHGLGMSPIEWTTNSARNVCGGTYDDVYYDDGVLYGYHVGKRFLELTQGSDTQPTDVVYTDLNEVWTPFLEYTPPKKPAQPTIIANNNIPQPPLNRLPVVDLDTGLPKHESLEWFVTGLMVGSEITASKQPMLITCATASDLTTLLQSVNHGYDAYDAGVFYGKLYRRLHPNPNWSLEMLLECQLFNPGTQDYLARIDLPEFNVYAKELIQKINDWAVNRRNFMAGRVPVFQTQWGSPANFGTEFHMRSACAWPQQSVWGQSDLNASSYSYVDGLAVAVEQEYRPWMVPGNNISCSTLNAKFSHVDRVEAWLYGYFTGRRYAELKGGRRMPVLEVLNDPFLNNVWDTGLTDTPRKNNVGGSLEQAIFQYGLNGGEAPLMRIGELTSTRILELLEAGYNNRINVIGQPPLHDVVEVINKLKSDKQQINQEKV